MQPNKPASIRIDDPLLKHYPAVYWFWHHVPSRQEIEKQLSEIKKAGYGTFLIQPRLAFPIHEYLGVGYLQAYRIAIETAAKMGLKAGLYDEYNWISGHAGGRMVKNHEELRERQLFWSQAKIDHGKAICSITGIHNCMGDGLGQAFQQWIYEGREAKWGDWQVVRAFVCKGNSAPVDVTAHCRLIAEDPDGCQVLVEVDDPLDSDARVIVFIAARCITSRLVNLLHPNTARRFIEAGYEPYRTAVGDFFGSTIDFLFIDQPYTGFYTWNEHFGNPLNSLMYDESLDQVFYERHDYDLGQALLSLVTKENHDSPRLRCDFFETYGELARTRFLSPLYDWAHENGLKFSGHELLGYVGGWGFADGLQGIDARVNFGADYFAVDVYKDISAVDACNYHPQLSARFGDSLARSHDRKGCIVEQYSVPVGRELPAPAGQWDLTLGELRSQAIRHLLYGANTFLFHAFYQTNDIGLEVQPMQSPRFDFPPGINYEPWFRFHPQFAEELARLNSLMEDIQPQSRIALLYPLRAYWHDGPDGSFNAESAFWNRWLTESGFQYDIINERQVNAGKLAERGYRLLILPGTSVVQDEQFFTDVEKFVKNDGWMIASGDLPKATQQKGRDDDLAQKFTDLIERNPRTIVYSDHLEAEQDDALPARVAALQDGINVQPLDDLMKIPVIRQGSYADGIAIVLFNDSDVERHLRLTVPCEDACVLYPERYFPHNGHREKWIYYDHTAKSIDLDIWLKARELACFKFTRENKRVSGKSAEVFPHLCKLEGNTIVEACDLDQNNRISVTLRCGCQGPLRLLVRSQEQPQISPAGWVKEVQHQEDDHWQIDVEIPEIPQPVILREGWTLHLPHDYREKPVSLHQGWEKDHPFYSGVGYYGTRFELYGNTQNLDWELRCPSVHTAISVVLNQVLVGACGWAPYTLMLPKNIFKSAYNQLQIAVWTTAGNALYQDTPYQRNNPFPSGLDEPPVLYPSLRLIMTAK